MKKLNLLTLIVGDSELECECKNKTLEDINVGLLSFGVTDLEKYDLIIYSGDKGTKILKFQK